MAGQGYRGVTSYTGGYCKEGAHTSHTPFFCLYMSAFRELSVYLIVFPSNTGGNPRLFSSLLKATLFYFIILCTKGYTLSYFIPPP